MVDTFSDPCLEEFALEEPSGFQQAMRYRLTRWADGCAELEMMLDHQHMNRRRVAHGGLLAALIDTVCGFSGGFCDTPGQQPGIATLSLTTSFVAPARSGLLRAVGKKRGGGRRIFFASGEIYDEERSLIAFGEGVYSAR